MQRKITIKVEPRKGRQGVPAHLAARYSERTVRPKKGRGSYTRKGRQ